MAEGPRGHRWSASSSTRRELSLGRRVQLATGWVVVRFRQASIGTTSLALNDSHLHISLPIQSPRTNGSKRHFRRAFFLFDIHPGIATVTEHGTMNPLYDLCNETDGYVFLSFFPTGHTAVISLYPVLGSVIGRGFLNRFSRLFSCPRSSNPLPTVHLPNQEGRL